MYHHEKCLGKVPIVGKLGGIASDVVGRVRDADVAAVLGGEVDDLLDELLDENHGLRTGASGLGLAHRHQLVFRLIARGHHAVTPNPTSTSPSGIDRCCHCTSHPFVFLSTSRFAHSLAILALSAHFDNKRSSVDDGTAQRLMPATATQRGNRARACALHVGTKY